MFFKIRANDASEKKIYEKYKNYLRFLKNNRKVIDGNLLKYFGADFFHDGNIQEFKFSPNENTLSFLIDCCNFKVEEKNDFYFLPPLKFRCSFDGVVLFQFGEFQRTSIEKPEKRYLFLESEIQTLTKPEQNLKSLLIKTLPFKKRISIIFKDLKVVPLNKKRFQAIEKSKKVSFPKLTM